MDRFAEKKAVIIGGTTGLGLGIAEALLREGADVLVTGLNEHHLDESRRTLGPRAHVVRSDTSSMADIERLAALVREELGTVDSVFVNAGVAKVTPFASVTESEYDRTFAVNTKGAFFTVQRLAPLVRDGGSFVFTTSVADEVGVPGLCVYSGSKAALRSFAQGFAAELLARGIRVNALSPGFVNTPTMGVAATAEERSAFAREGELITPMRRIATVDEVARAALFLAFDATFTTGIELNVDGGMTQVLASHG